MTHPVDVSVPEAWLANLEQRHLSDLRFSEVSRALRALSSIYVERRHTALANGRALDGAGKRAAFALYYAPLHFLAATAVLAAVFPKPTAGRAGEALPVVDLGCGTGAVGAAAAAWTGARDVTGIDTHPWALDEARHTYASFGLRATVRKGHAARLSPPRTPAFIVAGHVVNELNDEERAELLRALTGAAQRGCGFLILEPLARAVAPWWPSWVQALGPLGARADEWKLVVRPPDLVRRLGDAAGLTSTAVNVRSLFRAPA